MDFNIDRLLDRLTALTPEQTRRYIVAYSGGCDSQVLLHALASLKNHLPGQVLAVHINHGLQPEAVLWAAHCAESCRSLEIPLETTSLELEPEPGESIEAVAREARYAAIQRLVKPYDVLLTAHHQDDQAETLLLQLFRGAGLRGMAAMPEVATFGPGYLVRPLLEFSRTQLETYATANGLSWVDDQSNLDQRYDRNFLRQNVMPVLLERWPSLRQTLSRSASYCAEAQNEIERVARDDLALIRDAVTNTLAIPQLMALDNPRLRSALRLWIRESGCRAPNSRRMKQIVTEVLGAADDRNPVVSWDGSEVRRYRGQLYIMPTVNYPDPGLTLAWNGVDELTLPAGMGVLSCRPGEGGIDATLWKQGKLSVGFRPEGVKCRPAGRGVSVTLKKLFQEQGVPPWQRGRIPLLFIDGQLAAVGSLTVCEPFQAIAGAPGVLLRQA
ncbi:MAG: tRNA lysidine(34) synthetase TilS [Candidatus Sedimenticola sp. 20ELBAFRAG]